jgi:type II secretory pathway pseudopilin PulG
LNIDKPQPFPNQIKSRHKILNGLTLLELLLVIGIIGLLLGLSLPAYLKARNQAQKVACRITLRSYAIEYTRQGGLMIVIPQEANCHDCHRPRYDAGKYLDTVDKTGE